MGWLDDLASERNTSGTRNRVSMARREGFEPPTLRFEEESEPEEDQ